jgi:catechol 2,3-dioxygenase-like lactoylglutathione lyase family enzyme
MLQIVALDHIVLNVADVERSLEFYQRHLGLPAERVEGWRKGELPFPSLRINEATIVDLVAAAPDRARCENLAHFCLVTDGPDLESVKCGLEAAGVPVERGPVLRSGARGNALSIYFRDPDHNLVELRTYAGVAPE